MLDTDTKRRIDTARDILVGKVPDPKSQVEQITIALIYKFMDDIDADSEELGGERKFFAGEFAKYGWAKLMSSGLGGYDTLNRYAEAITRMRENPGIPPLFRSIFDNAYLPYRDPETLRAFLKVIDEFTYDYTERLGDAFEYLLSVMGAQGDAGQFLTPRHIIDFIVAIVDPQKGETVLDPACGTAGFLISSYNHIKDANTDEERQLTLTPDDRDRLAENFKGYDISPDMVRLSLVNMYLHGFPAPHIFEYDTLTSEERWSDYADVILANPPFMSPKGGIRPHNRFSVQSKRSEVLFVDYMAEHLTPTGRAGIIVPEGIIFQSQLAHTQLRKKLVEEYLVAVVSLPAGVFQPYSGVKTSILILDRALARRTDRIAFFKVENDGFDLGAQRRPIDKNDLPRVAAAVKEYMKMAGKDKEEQNSRPSMLDQLIEQGAALIVEKDKLAANGDYNLSGERYRGPGNIRTQFELAPLGRFAARKVASLDPRKFPHEVFELWSIPAFDSGAPEICEGGVIGSQKKCVEPGDVLLSRIIPHIRRAWVVKTPDSPRRQIASTEWMVFRTDEIIPGYLRHVLVSDPFHVQFMQTVSGVGGSLSRARPDAVKEIEIPLPPLQVQQEIVAEIEGYQRVIDGARAVVESYRPQIVVDPEWPMVALGEITLGKPQYGSVARKVPYDGKVRYVRITDLTDSGELKADDPVSPSVIQPDRFLDPGDLLIARSGSVGRTYLHKKIPGTYQYAGYLIRFRIDPNKALSEYVFYVSKSDPWREQILSNSKTGTLTNINAKQYASFRFPLPPLKVQQAIVAEIEAEQALVAANRELIERFERKIETTIGRVWGE